VTTTKTGSAALELAHQQLVDAVDQLITSDDWLRFLAAASRFHRYSVNNVLLIMKQAPTATQVASYTTWQQLGRQVRKGEKGIKILAPCRYPVKDAGTATDVKEEKYAVRGFRLASVFDVGQTDGEALPSVEGPKLLEGDAPQGMWDAIRDLIVGEGFSVGRADLGEANGVTRFDTKEVLVAPHLSDRAAVKTLCHELAHVRLHGDRLVSRSRELSEAEAESCAYLISQAWGMDSSDYSIPYVAHWAQSSELVKTTMDRVVAASRQIITECGLS
jgi:N-terminal domain of anti-restriction factor ArdC